MKSKMICAVLAGMLIMWFVGPWIERRTEGLPKVSAAGNLNVAVLCSSCRMGNVSGMILLDQNSGKVWLYSDEALLGLRAPGQIGTIDELGKKTIRAQ